MAVGIPGVGMVRFLSIGIGLNDQFSQGAAKLNAQVNAMTTAMAGLDRQMNLIRSKLFLTGFATATIIGGIAKSGAETEKQLTIAAHAAGGIEQNMGRLRKEAHGLAVEFGISTSAAAELLKDVEQLGVPSQFADDMANAGLLLQQVTGGEIEGGSVAATLFRISQSTAATNEEFEHFLATSDRFASAIKRVGDLSAAGTPAVTRMLEGFQSLGTIANLTREQLLVLAGGLTDVDEGARQAFSTALTRIFSDKFMRPEVVEQVAAMMGLTADEVVRLRREDPFTLITQFAKALGELEGEAPSIEILEGLHFTQRDKRLFAAITQSQGKMAKMMGIVNEEMGKSGDALTIMQQMQDISSTLAFSWGQLGGAVSNFADTVTRFLAPVLVPLLKMLTGLIDTIAQNKFIAGTITITALGAVIGSMVTGIRALQSMSAMIAAQQGFSDPMAAFGLRGGAKAFGRGAGRAGLSLADKALFAASFMPFGIGKGLKGKRGADMAKFFKGRAGAGLFAAQRGAGEMPGIAATLGQKSAVSRSGGILARLLGGVGGKTGARAAGALAAKQIGGKALINVIPVIGQVLSLLSLLEKPFGFMADAMQNMADKAGPLGFVLDILSVILRVFQFLGAVINGAINTIINAVKALIGWVEKIPGVKKVGDAIGGAFDSVNDFLKGGAEKVRGGITFNQTNNFSNEAGSDSGLRRAEEDNGLRAAGLTPAAARPGGG